MINLILKDILLQKKTAVYLLLYIAIFILAFQSIAAGAFTAIVIALTYQMVSTVCNYDDKANSDIVMNSLPLTRKTIVLSKYLSVIVYALLAIVGYMAFTLIFTLMPVGLKIYPITLEGLSVALAGVMVMNGIYYPVYFKLGYNKARIVSFILFFIFFFGGMTLIQTKINLADITNQSAGGYLNQGMNIMQFVLIIAAAAVLFAASCFISVRFYSNREF